jgi:hypothetical protein
MTPNQKAAIDNLTPYALLYRWRFAKSGDPLLQGEAGEYLGKRILEVRDELGPRWATLSKEVGWDA